LGWIGAIFLAPKLPRPPRTGGSIDYQVGSRLRIVTKFYLANYSTVKSGITNLCVYLDI